MIINIAFSSDNNYAPFLCVAIYSLLKSSNSKNNYHIYILDGGISKENKNKILKSLNKLKNKKIEFIEVDKKIFKNIKQFLQLNQSAYYRLLLPIILPKVKKIIYGDCDLLILKDISKLYNEQINKNLIGCCQIFHPNYKQVLQKIYPKIKIKTAINSGVTLMDLNKLRKGDYSTKFINFVNQNSEKLIAGDQDVLNIILNDDIKILHPKWNSTSYLFVTKDNKKCNLNKKVFNTCVDNPSIVHFDGTKPWASGSSHPYKKTYEKYLNETEFKNYKDEFNFKKFIKNKIFYTGNIIANMLPNFLYNIIEKQYLKNNFLEKKFKEISKNANQNN